MKSKVVHTGNKIVIKNMHMFSKTPKCAFELRKKKRKDAPSKLALMEDVCV